MSLLSISHGQMSAHSAAFLVVMIAIVTFFISMVYMYMHPLMAFVANAERANARLQETIENQTFPIDATDLVYPVERVEVKPVEI